MKDILFYIISSIVEDPKELEIEETEENGSVNLNAKIPKNDIGKVIGKEGKIIRAIRNVMKIAAIKQGKYINISLSEK